MKYINLVLMLCVFVAHKAVADSEIAPFPKVDKPYDGACYIKQIPAKLSYITNSSHEVIKTVVAEEAFVKAYRILPDGKDEFLWSSVGWYANKVFLTSDCQYLVRMGDWARGSEPSSEDLAVAFYKNGELLRSYSTLDVIENKKSVDVSIGHYLWQSRDSTYPRLVIPTGTFYLKTIEEKELEFNYKTGRVKKH